MLTQQTLETLRALSLTGMADAYEAQLRDAEAQALSFDERLGLLADREWSDRQTRRLVRRLQIARLPMPAAIEDLDYSTPRGLDRGTMRMLAEGRWLHEHMNLILCGPTGVGKTYVASALGHAACRQSFRVRYYRVSRLVGDLTIAKADGSYPRLMRALAQTDLLVLDDWGLAPLTTGEARELLEVIDDRCNRRSTLVASQLPVDTWHSAIPDPSIADALLDRIVHTAHKVVLKGESMRKLRAKRKSEEAKDSGRTR
jgi:DNA replication protein DnaC